MKCRQREAFSASLTGCQKARDSDDFWRRWTRCAEFQRANCASVLNVVSERHLAACRAIDFAGNVGGLILARKTRLERVRQAGPRVERVCTELFYLLLGHSGGDKGVQTGRRATALTRTPRLMARPASERVKLAMAALVEA